MTPLTELAMRLEAAQTALVLLDEMGAANNVVRAQQMRCRDIRMQMDALIPECRTEETGLTVAWIK